MPLVPCTLWQERSRSGAARIRDYRIAALADGKTSMGEILPSERIFDPLVPAPTAPPRTFAIMRLAVDMASGIPLRIANGCTLAPRQHTIGLGAPLDLADTMLFRHQTSVFVPGQLAGTARTLDPDTLPVLPGIDVSPRIPVMRETGRRGGN